MNTTGYSNLKFSYGITSEASGVDQNKITVSTDKGDVVVESKAIAATKTYQLVELTLQDGITFIQLAGATANEKGYRINNLKLVGVGK